MKKRSVTTIVFIILLAGLAMAGDKLTGTRGAVPTGFPDAPQSPLVEGAGNRAISCLLLSNYAGDLTNTKAFFEANMLDITFDTFECASATPTVTQLEGYDVVLLMENGIYGNAPNVGDVLYDFVVNSLGNVVYGTFIWQDWTTWGGYGYGLMESICPLIENGGCEYTYDWLDMGSVVTHPVTDSITGLFGSYQGGTAVSAAGTLLGNWSDGTPAIAIDDVTGGRQCAISIFPAYESWGVYGTDFGGDFYLLFENALKWAAGGAGSQEPRLDIDCNGENGPIEVFEGTNCTITIDVEARGFLGYPVDVWVAIKAPSGTWWTWQYGNWYPDLSHAAWSSGLLDWSGTVLDMALPLGSYKAYLALDTIVNGQLDLGAIYDMDVVEFDVVVPPTEYKWDSGTTDNLLCWVSGGDMVGMHCFDTIPGGENLTNVGTIFGSVLYANYAPGNGTPTEFYVWEATSFGDPTNATLLAQGTGVVGNVDTDVHYWDACPCTITTPNFYVAYNLHHAAYEYCLAIDGSVQYVYGAAFYTGTNTLNAFDPVNLYANQYPPDESPYGFWTVRAEY